MLPRITTQSFFALLCLWVVALAVFASPLPAGGSAGTAPAPITAGPPRPPKVQVDLEVIIIHQDTLEEHVFLAIGDAALHAGVLRTQRVAKDSVLVPQKAYTPRIQMKTEASPKTTSIGKASFVSRNDREKVIDEMLDVKMP
ncbi:hypothetical protein F5051DRAFT_174426, partial [Lentinula edodes]